MTTDPPDQLRRRSLLATLSAVPLGATLAGCQDFEVGDSDLEDVNVTVDDSDGGGAGTDDSSTADGDPAETVPFAEVIQFDQEYELSAVPAASADSPLQVSGRFHGENHAVRSERGDRLTESVLVSGVRYVVSGDDCVRYPEATAGAEGGDLDGGESSGDDGGTTADGAETTTDDGETTADAAELAESYPGLVPTGTDSIDDREMRTFELRGDALPGFDGAVTYYVDVETGFLRRIESEAAVVDYDSWGDVDDIDDPDVDCRDAE